MSSTSPDRIQTRLLAIAGLFLTFFAIALTIAPSVRLGFETASLNWSHWIGWFIWVVGFFIVNHESSHRLPNRDPFLIPLASLLSGWGLLSTWRLFPYFGIRQSIWFSLALLILFFGMRLNHDLKFLRRYKYLWLMGGLALTALTLILGTNPSGANEPRLWLGCCGIYLQPSEPLKLLLVIYLAAYLADRLWIPSSSPNNPLSPRLFPLLAPTLVMTGLSLLLLVIQRDLGTASIFLFLYATIVFISTGKKQILLVSLLALLTTGLLGYQLFDIVKIRVDAWLNPWLDPSGGSYQIIQSLMALANGGIPGRGPGLGNPALVPVPHSDFIFASITEESGLFGALAILLIFAILLERGLVIAFNAKDSFRRYLSAGLTIFLVGQSILIIGGNLRLLPLTGVTLPFVSYGGSSLLTSFITLLFMLIISETNEEKPAILIDAKPYKIVGILLFIGIISAMVLATWWTTIRASNLTNRTDNARRSIADRYVMRGKILDRAGKSISQSEGQPGDYHRVLNYPFLSNIIGYTHPIYGQSGLEAAFDPYLRGLQGNPSNLVEINYLLYGVPPPGIDIRLSLDINISTQANMLLGNRPGAILLIDAESGEILGMASQPSFTIDQLDIDLSALLDDPSTPLLNRVTQGLYPPGSIISPFLFLHASESGQIIAEDVQTMNQELKNADCSFQPPSQSFLDRLRAGCISPLIEMIQQLDQDALIERISRLGFYAAPEIQFPVAFDKKPEEIPDKTAYLLGGYSTKIMDQGGKTTPEQTLRISPMQLAYAAAALVNSGSRPLPQLLLATNQPETGWLLQSTHRSSIPVFDPGRLPSLIQKLSIPETNFWGIVSVVPNGLDKFITWFMGGNLDTDENKKYITVVLIEEANPQLAQSAGMHLLEFASK